MRRTTVLLTATGENHVLSQRLSAEQLRGYVLMRINSGLKPRSTDVKIAALRLLFRNVTVMLSLARLGIDYGKPHHIRSQFHTLTT